MNPVFMYVVWTVIAAAVVATAVSLIRVLIRLRPLIDRLESTVQFLETNRPKFERILDDVEVELVALRGISEKANRIVGSAESVTTGLRVAVQPIITEVSDLGQLVRHARAGVVAFLAGLTALREHRRGNGGERAAAIEHDDESRG